MKKYLKKSLSVFLSFLMVLSCFVFAPEMFTFEADAAQGGNYTISLVFQVDNACDGDTSMKITYKANNGTGSSTTTTYTLNEVKGETGSVTVTKSVPGFPTDVWVSMKTPWWTQTDVSLKQILINGTNVFRKSDGSNDNYTYDPGYGSTTKYTFSQSNYSTYWVSPKPTSIDWNQGTTAHTVIVPDTTAQNYDSSKASATFTSGSTVLDQYGVAWYQPANYTLYADTERKSTVSVNGLSVATTGKASTAPTADFGKVTVTNTDALKNYVAYGTTTAGTGTPATSRSVYAFANFTYSGSTFYSAKYAKVDIVNPQYQWTFVPNGGSWTKDNLTTTFTQYYGTTLSDEQLPNESYVEKTGYTFQGFYDDSVKCDTSLKFTSNRTWKAKWSPIENKISFYNYDGQPLHEITAHYDDTIGSVMSSNGVTDPAGFSTSAATYKFKRWVDWDTGEELNENEKLQNLNSAKVRKFIAEYEVDDGQVAPTFNYNFYSNGLKVGQGTDIYRSSVTFPTNPTKPTETKDNGYSYEFAGWIVDNTNYDTKSDDVIVDTTKGETLEAKIAGKTFLSVEDGDFHYFLKENIKFYPVFIAKYKQVTITLHYRDANGAWQESKTSNENTICQNTFDLGIPNPKSYNTAEKSYTFIGWTTVKNPTAGSSKPTFSLGDGSSINIELENNCEYWACYSESDVHYYAYYYKDGAILDEYEVGYKETFNVGVRGEGITTDKAREDMTGYKFLGWSLTAPGVDEEGNAIDQPLVETYNIESSGSLANPTFYAVYESFDYYEVTFVDDAGKELQTSKDYVKDDTLTPPEVKDKDDENDAQYTEAFIGWKDSKGTFHAKDDELKVTGNETYKAVFEKKVRQYVITFYDVNGQTFDENEVETSTPIATATLDYGTNIQDWITENWTEGEKLEEKIEASIPEDTKQYVYTFNGWSPNLNNETTVKGTATYKATYKTSRVEYKVHWLNADAKSEFALTKYFYQGNIMTPSGKPVSADPEDYDNYPTAEYTWSFLGWYACDDKGNLKTDAETGEYVKFAKGMKADVEDQYFIARFGYVAKKFAITIYDADKTTVLETIDGKEANAIIDITLAYTKAPTADKHYIPTSLMYMNAEEGDDAAATFTDNKASYKVGTYNELYVVYTEAAHNHDEANWKTTQEPTYGADGIKENACTVCGYIKTGSIAKYIDDQAPAGIVYIGGYTWDDIADTTKTAYVKAGSLVNIITRDLGSKTVHSDETAGVGIKKIDYVFLDGSETSYTYTTINVEDKFTINKNVDISLPDDFAGKYLTVVITDYNGETYTITTNTLQVDSQKPVIDAIYDCENIFFGIKEDNEIATVLIEKYNAETKTWAAVDAAEWTTGDVTGSDYKVGYMITSPNGTYRITATDMAGNTSATVTATATGAHELGDYVITTEATCTSEGAKHKECKNCDYKTDDEVIEKIAHKYPDAGSDKEYTVDLEPTCTEKGSKSIHCTVCDTVKKDSEVEIAAKGHEEVEKVVEATCTKDGYKLVTCKNCDLWTLTTKGYEATGHTADPAKHVHKDATCSEEGYDYDICAKCEAKISEKTLDKIAHTYEDATPETACKGYVVVNEVKQFYKVNKCSVCGYTEELFPELKDHAYSDKTDAEHCTYTEATCEANGYWTYTCTHEGCEVTKTETDRYTAKGHDYEWIVDTAAKCEEKGSKHEECKNCHDKKDAVEIPATGHDLVKDEANYKDATCGTDGVDAKKCNNTGCTYTETTKIPATGKHSYTVALTGEGNYLAATCEADGYQVYQCNGCTATEKKTITALGHKHAGDDKGTVTKVADCKNTGERTYNCINGDHTFTEVIPVDTKNHDTVDATVVKVVTAATCTAGGKEIRNCKRCGSAVEVETDALDHDFTKWVQTKAATCVDDGQEKLVCSRCGVDCTDKDITTTRPITATGKHNLKTHAKVDAKCTVDGTDTYYECKVCGKLFSDAEGKTEITTAPVIKAEGHKWGEYITVAATCSADGYKYKVCSVCGDKSAKEATGETKLNHSTDKGAVHTLVKVNKAATCSAVGQGVYKCSLCGELFTRDIAKDENAHSAVWSTTAATCTADGKRVKKCDLCKKVLAEETIDALGHSYKITTKDVYEDGKIYTETTQTCSRCGDKQSSKALKGEACKVTFAGAASGEMTVDKGGKLKKSDLPTVDLTSDKDGWAKKVTWTVDGKEATFPMTVNGDITVTAKVTEYELQYTVEFVHTLSKDVLSSNTYKYNEKVTAPDDLSVPGYTFGGWSVSPSDSSVTVYSKDTIPAATADTTYYAVFTAVAGATTYYVTFKSGTKTVASEIVTKGGTVNAPAAPTKASNSVFHYTFAGWTDKDGKAVTFPMTVTTNVTVYAKFNEVKHADCKTVVAGSIKAATCTEPAEVTYKCKDCGYSWVQYTAEALGHDYVEVPDSRVDDGSKVTVTYKCSRCESSWKKTVVYNASANIVVITVKDTAGNPVEGASVQLYIGDLQTVTATTDANGQAKFPKYDAETAPNGLKDGNYTVKVTKTGYNTASGTLTVKDGSGSINLTFAKIDCHCICHSSNVFGKIRRFFNKLIRSIFNKNYTCCDCGECEVIH